MLLHAPRRTNYRGPGLGAASQRVPWYSRARCRMWCYRLSLDVVALLRAEEGLRGLACESVEALAVKFGLRASAGVFCVWVRWRGGRGRCVRRARGGGASLRQLLQRVVLQGCVCRRAREKLRVFAQRGVFTTSGSICASLHVQRTLRGAVCRLLFSGEAGCQDSRVWW